MAKPKSKARILVALTLDQKEYKPNNVVSLDGALARTLEKDGQVDTSPAAVTYCLSQGAEVIEHEVPQEPEPVEPVTETPPD